ncbi:hypothetical protein XI06_14110 [Bradyrhizobium sp. CCBAU 11434]|uniref:hypothetical protein n=1 Tax=Bradyrhizobium sp. CCBAU 11434 TaxID=1630885 RepID=UPI002306CDD8|nr:hypothetical protein [Bradyrhizobium sp. CCBAU 11434]MDA9521457.1 hypothetical protein [Bradyrhizobium sp. CCBAU 11434]
MDRIDHRAWAEQLRRENDEMRGDMQRRREKRELNGDGEMWKLPDERNAVRKHAPSSGLIFKTTAEALVEKPQPDFVSRAEVIDLVEGIAEVTGRLERMVCRGGDGTAVDALREEVSTRLGSIEARQDELESRLDALETDISEVLNRGSNVAWLTKRKTHAA